jgi:hypothetical protein
MDWQLAIERNREALKRVLAGLVVLAGPDMRGRLTHLLSPRAAQPALADMGQPSPHFPAPTLPRRLHRAVLRLLRPAESAARRLIVVAARALGLGLQGNAGETAVAAGAEPAPPPRRPAPKSPAPALRRLGIAVVVPPGVALAAPAPRRVSTTLLLPICDPPRSFALRRRTVPPHAAPRILSLDGQAPHRLPPKPAPGDAVDATRLLRRLAALGAALDDLPGQARRFVRWQARRARDLARERAKALAGLKLPLRWRGLSPLRFGRPPGLRVRAAAEACQTILRDLEWFAGHALAPPDTS